MEIDENKVFIATPMYGGVCHSSYTVGLVDTITALREIGYKTCFASINNDSLITRARNALVGSFLRTDAKYLLFIDADIGFFSKDVIKLLEAKKDLICGIYPKKLIDWDRLNVIAKSTTVSNLEDYAGSFVVNPVYSIENPDAPLDSPIIEISHGGTGFMLITRDVFIKLAPHVKQYRNSTLPDRKGNIEPLTKEYFAIGIQNEENNYFLSEDYYFCELWRKHGGKIYADLTIKLTHTGNYVFNGDLFTGGSNRR